MIISWIRNYFTSFLESFSLSRSAIIFESYSYRLFLFCPVNNQACSICAKMLMTSIQPGDNSWRRWRGFALAFGDIFSHSFCYHQSSSMFLSYHSSVVQKKVESKSRKAFKVPISLFIAMIIDRCTLIQVRVPPSITAVPPGGSVTGPTTTFPSETVPKTLRTKFFL